MGLAESSRLDTPYREDWSVKRAVNYWLPGTWLAFISVYSDGERVREVVGLPEDAEAITRTANRIYEFRSDQTYQPQVEVIPVDKEDARNVPFLGFTGDV